MGTKDYMFKTQEARNTIRYLIHTQDQVHLHTICRIIGETHGFGRTFVKRYLEELETDGFVKSENNIIIDLRKKQNDESKMPEV